MMRSFYLVAVGILLCMSSPALAGAAEDYQSLFGQDEKAALRSTKEAAPFAAKLLTAAKAVGDQKDFQAILCEKAYEFGVKDPAGYPTAIDAMKLLMEAAPTKAAKARESLLKVQQLRYARSTGDERKRLGNELVSSLLTSGDEELAAQKPVEALALYRQALTLSTGGGSERTGEIMEKIKQVVARGEAEKTRATLIARLQKDPKDSAPRAQLIMAYLGEYDTPGEAEKLLSNDLDKDLRDHVVLALKPVEELDEATCMNLAEWYAQAAAKASAAGKPVFQGKVATCCERYLTLHTAQDVGRLKALKLMEGMPRTTVPRVAGIPKFIVLDLAKGVPLKMVLIPAGEFVMGSPKDEPKRQNDEGQHKVKITRAFFLGETEVTQRQWMALMPINPSRSRAEDRPVDKVTFDDAASFCRKLGEKTGKKLRLPTEAEWEYACRAGTTTTYNTGDDPNALAEAGWFTENCSGKTQAVGLKKANAWGLYDMHGNVWEWCSDWCGRYPEGAAVDPAGPAEGTWHVLRGGSWYDTPDVCRSATRIKVNFGEPDMRIGLRVAMDATLATARDTATPATVATTPAATTPAATTPAAAAINLMTRLKLQRDVAGGTWTLGPGGLVSDGTRPAKIRLGYEPPEEYDFRVEFTRQTGREGVALIVSHAGGNFNWTLGGDDREIWSGMEVYKGKRANVQLERFSLWCSVVTAVTEVSVAVIRSDREECFLDGIHDGVEGAGRCLA